MKFAPSLPPLTAAQERALSSGQLARPTRLSGIRFHAFCCLIYTLLCVGWNLWAGRDQSWDQLNYHLYVALAWWQDRLPDELFAASVQGYLNPLPHLPFFAAFSTGWPSPVGSTVIAILHSTNLWLLHLISIELTATSDRLRRLLVFCGVLLGALTPAFLIETGTSFTDVIVSIPSLAALLCLLYWQRHHAAAPSRTSWGYLYLAGLLAGFATGLKASALIFGAAMGLAAILFGGSRSAAVMWRAFLSGLAGFILGGGSHAVMLWRAFGNPVFPLFNGVFQSPWFMSANVVSERFRPASLTEALKYPLNLADAFNRVGFESIAADIRPISLIGLLVVTGLTATIHKRQDAARTLLEQRNSRLLWSTLIIFFPAWLYTSGNTRYAVQGLMLLGPALTLVALRLPGRSAIWPMLALGLPLAAQATASFTLNATRWNVRPWSKSWFDLEIPVPLRSRPAYYLSLQTQTYSALATVLPANSRFTNLIGQNTLDPAGPAWRLVRQDQRIKEVPWRSLSAVPSLIKPGGVPANSLDIQDARLSEYGLKTNRKDCEWIILDGVGEPPLTWTSAMQGAIYIKESKREVILSCALIVSPPLDAREAARRESVDARMNAWEERCPNYFSPAKTRSEQLPDQRRRMYISTDTMILESNGQLLGATLAGGQTFRLEDNQGRRLIDNCPQKRGLQVQPEKSLAP